MHAGRVDPAIVEVEQRANGDGVIDLPRRSSRLRTAAACPSAVIRGESRLTLSTNRNSAFSASRRAPTFPDRPAPRPPVRRLPSSSAATAACDFSQNGQSIARRSVSRNQLPQARAERRLPAHDLLREERQMLGGRGLEREQMPDLRILAAQLSACCRCCRPTRALASDCASTSGRNMGSMVTMETNADPPGSQ